MLDSHGAEVEQSEAQTDVERRIADRKAMWPRVVLRIREQMSDVDLTVDDIGFDPVRERRVLTKAEKTQAAPSYPTPWLTSVWPHQGEDPDVWYNRYSCAQLTALETCERLICTYDLTLDQVIHTKLKDAVKVKPAAKRDALIEASRLWRVFRISRRQFWDHIP